MDWTICEWRSREGGYDAKHGGRRARCHRRSDLLGSQWPSPCSSLWAGPERCGRDGKPATTTRPRRERLEAPIAPRSLGRRHHYVPRFFLALFTVERADDGLLNVVGLPAGRVWTSTATNLAHERDFYRVDVDGVSPNAFEDGMAVFEGRAADVVRSIALTQAIPTGPAFSTFVNFLSLLVARVPATRDIFDRYLRERGEEVLVRLVASEDAFTEDVYGRANCPEEDADTPTYREMFEYVAENAASLAISKRTHILQMLEAHDALLDPLSRRHWTVAVAPSSAEFVVSDRPVTLYWQEPRATAPPWTGYWEAGTDVILPVGRHVAVIGRFEESKPLVRLAPKVVAMINSRTIESATRFVAFGGPDFEWLDGRGRLRRSQHLLEAIRPTPG